MVPVAIQSLTSYGRAMRHVRAILVWLMGAAGILLVLPSLSAAGETGPAGVVSSTDIADPGPVDSDLAADESFHRGRLRHLAGDRAVLPRDRRQAYHEAIEAYRDATSIRPGFYRAHLSWMICLGQLLSITGDPAGKQELRRSIRERFQVAGQCPNVDGVLYWRYAGVLIESAAREELSREARLGILGEAKQVIEEGLEQAVYSGERARLGQDLGRCKFLIARETGDQAARARLLQSAIVQFENTPEVPETMVHTEAYAAWGMALFELGKLKHDRLILHQAVERLRRALENEPFHREINYTLGGCYAWLHQPDKALVYLEIAARSSPPGKFVSQARRDGDLVNLHQHPRFLELLAEHAASSPPAPASLR